MPNGVNRVRGSPHSKRRATTLLDGMGRTIAAPITSRWERVALPYLTKHLNFFRIHLLTFTIVPLIVSGIFYASNGKFKIPYIDCLLLCYSAMTVTGLATVNLSTLTAWQQAMLFILMAIGNVTVVSWVMVLVRKNFFVRRCEALLREDEQHRAARRGATMLLHPTGTPDGTGRMGGLKRKLSEVFQLTPQKVGSTSAAERTLHSIQEGAEGAETSEETTVAGESLRHRPSRLVLDPDFTPLTSDVSSAIVYDEPTEMDPPRLFDSPRPLSAIDQTSVHDRQLQGVANRSTISSLPDSALGSVEREAQTRASDYAVHFIPNLDGNSHLYHSRTHQPILQHTRPLVNPMRRQGSVALRPPSEDWNSRHEGMGGFDVMPAMAALLPVGLRQRMKQPERKVTLLRAAGGSPKAVEKKDGLEDLKEGANEVYEKAVKWLTFDRLLVGRNSRFLNLHSLSDEQLEELGGVEYRALRLLSYLVAIYWLATQLICFLLIWPYLAATDTWDSTFQDQPRLVSKPWFAAFNTLSAYTGGGLTLVDMGMVPFKSNYLMIFAMSWVILAGNHALPIFLRFIIWFGTKIVPQNGEWDQTLNFLLDHPRRCFLYLFPAHQTWYLTAILVFFIVLEWVAFGVLNIGLPILEELSMRQKIVHGFFQSICVRASGFQIVAISAAAPSLQFLYIGLMYIAVYPIAMSVRSTNTYEEKALGVYEHEGGVSPDEPEPDVKGSRSEVFGRYVSWHVRRQLAFDIWPLALGIFLISVIERTKIMDDDNAPWFNMFRIVFEATSAYAGIGLTLGIPTENYSFCGAFSPLAKLVVIGIMLRGRHRGLPQAIDRAIMLPREFKDRATMLERETLNAAGPSHPPVAVQM